MEGFQFLIPHPTKLTSNQIMLLIDLVEGDGQIHPVDKEKLREMDGKQLMCLDLSLLNLRNLEAVKNFRMKLMITGHYLTCSRIKL